MLEQKEATTDRRSGIHSQNNIVLQGCIYNQDIKTAPAHSVYLPGGLKQSTLICDFHSGAVMLLETINTLRCN